MSPFEEYLKKSKEVKAEYASLIAKKPAQKQQLEEEMKIILNKLLDEAEAKEIECSKHL